MTVIKNALVWADRVRRVFIPSLEFYRRVVIENCLPSLSEDVIMEEANQIEKEAFERMRRSVPPEDYEPGDFVEPAFNEGFEFYQLMHDTRQGLVNGLTAALYHLFEQQLCEFYRLIAWNKKAVLSGMHAQVKLRALGVDVAKFPEWKFLNELRLLANCVKHAEGSSCKQLAELRPDLFERPSIGPRFGGLRPFVERPLSGDGVYFSVAEFDTMADRLKRFWQWIANEISQWERSPAGSEEREVKRMRLTLKQAKFLMSLWERVEDQEIPSELHARVLGLRRALVDRVLDEPNRPGLEVSAEEAAVAHEFLEKLTRGIQRLILTLKS